MRSILLAVLLLFPSQLGSAPAAGTWERVQFVVRSVEEAGPARRVLYRATIDGPPRTDFTVALHDPRFELDASFITEPAGADHLEVRVQLESRRRRGTSPAGLPLWEIDQQEHRFSVGLDQQIDLLPFGGPGPEGLLKIEILPSRTWRAEQRPIEIRLDKGALGNAIEVNAFRTPHWYRLKAVLTDGKRLVAEGSGRLFREEAGELALVDARGLVIGNLSVTPTTIPYSDPWKSTMLRIDGNWAGESPRPLAQGWRGVVAGDGPLVYEVPSPERVGESWQLKISMEIEKENET